MRINYPKQRSKNLTNKKTTKSSESMESTKPNMRFMFQCAQIGNANHAHTITGYVRVNKVGAVSLVFLKFDQNMEEQ